jgi:hypothetical protein
MKLYLFLLWLPLISCWNHLQKVWEKGNFKKIGFNEKGPIQFLSLKKGGRCISYYNCIKNEITTKNSDIEYKINKKFVVDLAVENWNDTLYNMISFYDVKTNQYKTELTNHLTFSSYSRIVRTFLFQHDIDVMLGYILTSNGEIMKINNTIDSNTTYTKFNISTSIQQAEYYPPYIYIIDGYNQIYIYCIKRDKIIYSFNVDYFNSPIIDFNVCPTLTPNEYKIAIGFKNNMVHIFDMHKGKIKEDSKISFIVKTGIKKIYNDLYKCIIALDDNSVLFCSSITGTMWYKLDNIYDSNYITRLYSSHRVFITDGTNGLITYDIDSKKENVDFNDMEGLSRWLKTNYESNDIVTKKKSVFMEALMKTPVYNSEHLKVNWSFPIKNDDNNDLPSDTE